MAAFALLGAPVAAHAIGVIAQPSTQVAPASTTIDDLIAAPQGDKAQVAERVAPQTERLAAQADEPRDARAANPAAQPYARFVAPAPSNIDGAIELPADENRAGRSGNPVAQPYNWFVAAAPSSVAPAPSSVAPAPSNIDEAIELPADENRAARSGDAAQPFVWAAAPAPSNVSDAIASREAHDAKRLDRQGGTPSAEPQTAAVAQPLTQVAAPPSNIDAVIDGLAAREARDERRIDQQTALLAAQADELAKTKALITQQQEQLAAMKQDLENAGARLSLAEAGSVRAAGAPSHEAMLQIAQLDDARAGAGAAAGEPVGEAPPTSPNAALALPLPQGIAVLTPKGHFVFDNALEYQNSSSDRIVFQGIQLINAIQIGLLEANQTSNNAGFMLNTLRYGLTPNLEAEVVVPWVAREDRVTTVQTATPPETLSRVFNIRGGGLGDIEGTVRYQFNEGRDGWPIFVGALRVVSNSGRGPFDVNYNELGVAEKLPTGSGFWVVNPTLTAIYPLDPVVFYGAVGYQHGFGRNINKLFGTGNSLVHVGQAQPGDAFTLTAGFAFSVNSRFSYSLGYKQVYFEPSTTQFLQTQNNVVATKGESLALNDGSLLLGASYRINNHASVNLNFEFGVTADAPSDTVTLRVPYLF